MKENLTQAYGLDTHGPGSLFAGGGWKFTITFALQQKHYQRNVAISENNLNHNRTQRGTCVGLFLSLSLKYFKHKPLLSTNLPGSSEAFSIESELSSSDLLWVTDVFSAYSCDVCTFSFVTYSLFYSFLILFALF